MNRSLLYWALMLSACGKHGATPLEGSTRLTPSEPRLDKADTQELAATAGSFGNSGLVTALRPSSAAAPSNLIDNLRPFPNSRGFASTYSTAGAIDLNHPFFKSFGTNQRSCATCHSPATGWTVNPGDIRARFNATNGLDPIFRPVDGTVCAQANVSSVQARQFSYALLLNKGLFRVELPLPTSREFELVNATGTYCNTPMQSKVLALFRRPLPATNLKFIANVMWDGRESKDGLSVRDALMNQANDATVGHAQSTSQLSPETRQQIVDFETGLFTAQISSLAALDGNGANGGPKFLADVPFAIDINAEPNLNPVVFSLFDRWITGARSPGEAAIARGQQVFNTKRFRIRNVAGASSQDFVGSCATCHNTPNVGSYSETDFLNIGIGSASRRTPDLPLYTLRNKTTGATVSVSDVGRAMVTGKWADIGKFKPANLRALATRAPYFHDGSAPTIEDVIGFYEARFGISFTAMERADLSAFLRSL